MQKLHHMQIAHMMQSVKDCAGSYRLSPPPERSTPERSTPLPQRPPPQYAKIAAFIFLLHRLSSQCNQVKGPSSPSSISSSPSSIISSRHAALALFLHPLAAMQKLHHMQ